MRLRRPQEIVFANGKYLLRSGQWELVNWSSAVPSRLSLELPADIAEQIHAAKDARRPLAEPLFCADDAIAERGPLGSGVEPQFPHREILLIAGDQNEIVGQSDRRDRRVGQR
jgi:hypothetical protein